MSPIIHIFAFRLSRRREQAIEAEALRVAAGHSETHLQALWPRDMGGSNVQNLFFQVCFLKKNFFSFQTLVYNSKF